MALGRNMTGELFAAAARGSAAGVASALAGGGDPMAVDERGWTPLMWAARSAPDEGGAPCVGLLLPLSDPAREGEGGATAAMMAARAGNREAFSMIVGACGPGEVWRRDALGRDSAWLARLEGRTGMAAWISGGFLAGLEAGELTESPWRGGGGAGAPSV